MLGVEKAISYVYFPSAGGGGGGVDIDKGQDMPGVSKGYKGDVRERVTGEGT